MSVIAIASLLLSQVSTAQAPITLLYQPKVGSSYKNIMTMTQSGQMGDSSMTSTITTKVLSFEEGFYKLEGTTSDVKTTGGPAPAVPDKPSIMYVDQHFQPKVVADSNSSDAQKMMSGMSKALSGVLFPTKPVNIGDTWTNAIDFGALMGAVIKQEGLKTTGKINIGYKLVKADAAVVTIGATIGGTVTMDMSGTAGADGMKIPMTFAGGGTSTMDRATGVPLTNNMKMTLKMELGGQTMDIAMTIVIKPAS